MMLRTVSAASQISLPRRDGLSVEAPIAPSCTPSSSITSEMRLVHSPSARKRSTAPAGGFGVDCMRMRSAAIRPVSFLPLFSTPFLPPFLVEPDIGVPDHHRQALRLVLDEGAEFRRRAGDHIGALLGDARAHRRFL